MTSHSGDIFSMTSWLPVLFSLFPSHWRPYWKWPIRPDASAFWLATRALFVRLMQERWYFHCWAGMGAYRNTGQRPNGGGGFRTIHEFHLSGGVSAWNTAVEVPGPEWGNCFVPEKTPHLIKWPPFTFLAVWRGRRQARKVRNPYITTTRFIVVIFYQSWRLL